MKTSDIESKLAKAISDEVPDILDSILSKCEARDSGVIEIKQYQNKTKNGTWIKSLCASAAAVILIVSGYIGIGHYQSANTVESVITLDVNPSVKLETNKNKKVISAMGLNEDGNSVLLEIEQDGEKLKGKALDDAIHTLINTMVEDSYLSEFHNSILVSVYNTDDKTSKEIRSQVLSTASSTLSKKGINGAVVGQSGATDGATAKLAEQYGISEGKASFIQKIIEKAPEFSFAALAELNINDLNLLAEKWIGEMDDISIIGTPSDKGIVSSDTAVETACSNVNIKVEDVSEIGTSIKIADGELVFDVSLKAGGVEYKYFIDAKTGKILSWISKNIETGIVSADQNSTLDHITDDAKGNSDSAGTDSTQLQTDKIIDGIIDSAGYAAKESQIKPIIDGIIDIIDDFK